MKVAPIIEALNAAESRSRRFPSGSIFPKHPYFSNKWHASVIEIDYNAIATTSMNEK
jgi:hypothetical protein